MRPLTRDALAQGLCDLGLTDAHRDTLLAHARPELTLALTTDDVPVGASKIGGAPDLPDDTPWHTDRDAHALSLGSWPWTAWKWSQMGGFVSR